MSLVCTHIVASFYKLLKMPSFKLGASTRFSGTFQYQGTSTHIVIAHYYI